MNAGDQIVVLGPPEQLKGLEQIARLGATSQGAEA
jgi:malonyl CoA-acyl carrier protein transacylase